MYVCISTQFLTASVIGANSKRELNVIFTDRALIFFNIFLLNGGRLYINFSFSHGVQQLFAKMGILYILSKFKILYTKYTQTKKICKEASVQNTGTRA